MKKPKKNKNMQEKTKKTKKTKKTNFFQTCHRGGRAKPKKHKEYWFFLVFRIDLHKGPLKRKVFLVFICKSIQKTKKKQKS